MVSDSFLATSASNAVAFASDRNRKCHIICPCVTKSVWQLTSRPVTEGPEALQNGPWLFGGQSRRTARVYAAHMHGPMHDLHHGPSALVTDERGPHGSFVHGEAPSRFLFRHGVTLSEELQVICLDMMVGNGTLIGNTWFSGFERWIRRC